MKLLRLELLNLASLDKAGGEIIDFENGPLGESNIFSIVGPTGSGKSTILDAICLALFNRAPRYPKKKNDRNQSIEIYGKKNEEESCRLAPSDPRNILTHGKKYGYSKLTFQANNGNLYRAEWSVCFKRTRYDNAVTSLYVFRNEDGKITEAEADWNELPRIIGLDYEQFLRTVLIAQGSFANFLTAKEDERYELLEKLIGCEDLYSRIAAEIAMRRKEASDKYNEIRAGINAYANDDLAPDDLERLTAEIATLEKEKQANADALETVKKNLDWYDTDEKLCSDIAKAETAVNDAKKSLNALSDLQLRLTLHDTTSEGVRTYREQTALTNSIIETRAAIDNYANETDQLNKEIAELKTQLQDLQAKAKHAANTYEEQKPHINRAHEIKGEIESLQQQVDEKTSTLQQSQTAVDNATKAVNDNADAIRIADEALRKANADYAKIESETAQNLAKHTNNVAAVREEFDNFAKQLQAQDLASLQKTKTEADMTLADIRDAIRLTSSLTKKKADIEANTNERESLLKRNKEITAARAVINIRQLSDELTTLRKAHTLMTSENLALLRGDLVDGEPCPLCGATHHPYADSGELSNITGEMQGLIVAKEKELIRLQDRDFVLAQEKSQNEGSLIKLEAAARELSDEIERFGTELDTISVRHREWPADITQLDELTVSLTTQANVAESALSNYNSLANKTELARQALDKAIGELDSYRQLADRRLKEADQHRHDAQVALTKHQAQSSALSTQLDEKRQAAQTAASKLAETKGLLIQKRQQLKDEIGDNEPDQLDRTLTTAKENAERLVKEETEAIADTGLKVQELKGKTEIAVQNLDNYQKCHRELSSQLNLWLEKFNTNRDNPLTVINLAEISDYKDNWEGIRASIKEKSDALTAASATAQNTIERRTAHLAIRPEADRNTLTAQKEKLEAWKSEALDTARARLQAYHRAKEKMGELHEKHQEARHTLDEWDQICQAIGGEGKTLRKIAQCYTLRFLIAHANAEIRRFNTRYELTQVANSLGIRVIDHDRADDIRDTTSLSGGETFIVSLGLALGLSSLSSRNISFDNLFIDEGFGTLDPDTLATVIDSLASLQSSRGKKVGVISHTDMMSERISTQVRIIKNGNSGSSHIEIHTA
jgi:putative exonuclease sbcC